MFLFQEEIKGKRIETKRKRFFSPQNKGFSNNSFLPRSISCRSEPTPCGASSLTARTSLSTLSSIIPGKGQTIVNIGRNSGVCIYFDFAKAYEILKKLKNNTAK